MDVTAVCERSGDWWAVTVPEVPGAFTQAKRLDQVPAMVADAVSLLAEVSAEDVRVALETKIPGVTDWWLGLQSARELEEQARQIQAQASAARSRVLQELADAGLSARDMGQLTGVSHQRVSQVLSGHLKSGEAKVRKGQAVRIRRELKKAAVVKGHRTVGKSSHKLGGQGSRVRQG